MPPGPPGGKQTDYTAQKQCGLPVALGMRAVLNPRLGGDQEGERDHRDPLEREQFGKQQVDPSLMVSFPITKELVDSERQSILR